MERKESISRIFSRVLKSVDPLRIVKDYAEKVRSHYGQGNFSSLVVIGFGKASCPMARAVEEVFGTEAISAGAVITKYGHGGIGNTGLKKIKVYEAGHPLPDKQGITATAELIKLLQRRDENTLVLCLISGGGSALFVSPCEGITLEEKQQVTNLLLRSGADINELNALRKHLSRVKGGRLAEMARPAEVISLMISDVIGDRLDVIASGPTAPDSTTYQDALDVIRKYGLESRAPESIMAFLKRGIQGAVPDTPKKENPLFQRVQNIIIGSNRLAVEAAEREAESLGFQTEILSTAIQGEARVVGKGLAEKAQVIKARSDQGRVCLISGGETTVTVSGKGKGGRNTELALSFAMEIEGIKGITLLSAGTDGTDGPTDAAGAIVDGKTIERAKSLGLNPREYLDNNDSYHFFKQTDSLLITGPTGTNVMDVQIVLVE